MSHLHFGTGLEGASTKGLGGSAAGPVVAFLGQSLALPGFTLITGTDWSQAEDRARFGLGQNAESVLDALEGKALFAASGAIAGGFAAYAEGDSGPVLATAVGSGGTYAFELGAADGDALVEIALGAADLDAGSTIDLGGFGAVNLRLGDALAGNSLALGFDAVAGSIDAGIDGAQAILLDARGLAATGGLDASLGLGGGGGIAVVRGSLFGDSVAIDASAGGDTLLGSLGGGDDHWEGAAAGTETVVGGAGGDRIDAAGGDDLLFGDAGRGEAMNAVTLVTGEGAAEVLESGNATAARVELGFVGAEAGYRNLVGWYTVDAEGNVRTGRAVWDEDRAGALAGGAGGLVTAANLVLDMTPEEAANLQFFCVPDALNMTGQTTLREGSGSDGIVGTHGLSGRTAGMAIEVRIGDFGQGQVWIDLDGNGSAETLLQGRMSNRISSVDMNGAAAGGFLDSSNADGTGDNFGGFFSETSLNPHVGDYTANVGGSGTQFRNAGANAFNPATQTEDTTWGQIGFEDLYGGTTGTQFDRDYDDSVVQVKIAAVLQAGPGSDVLQGGFGADTLYGDGDAGAALATGGDDVLIGDANGALEAIGGSNDEADWISPLLALIEARGSWSGVIVPGSTTDWSKLASPANWGAPGAEGLGLRSGPGRNGETTTNPEINPGPGDELTFLLTEGADRIEVDFAAFYGREREQGQVELLDEAGDVVATVDFGADGTVSVVGDGHVAAIGGAGDSWDGVNPGRSTLTLAVTDGAMLHGLRFRAIDQNTNLTDNPSDYLITALRIGRAEGDDLLVGGLGLDLLQGDGDQGALSLGAGTVVQLGYTGDRTWTAEQVLADWLADGAAHGVVLRASLDEGRTWQTVDGAGDLGAGSSWFTAGADAGVYSPGLPMGVVGLGVADPAARIHNTRPLPGNAEINDSPGELGDVLEVGFATAIATLTLDFSLLYSREGQSWPEGPGEQVRIQLLGAEGDLVGEILRTRSELASGAWSTTNPGYGRVAIDAARLDALSAGREVFGLRLVGIDDSATLSGNANDAMLRGLSVGFVTADAAGGDVLDLSSQGAGHLVDRAADTVVWTGDTVDFGRGDGLDVVRGFDVEGDVLRFAERGQQVLRSVVFDNQLSTLVLDTLAAEGTGVVLVGVERSELALGLNLI